MARTFPRLVLSCLLFGCAPASTGGTGTGRAMPPVAAADGGTDEADAGPPRITPPSVDAGLDECASVTLEAETSIRPVDIVWVVDSSGSMRNEAARVQENMNRFASEILSAGIDPHVVVITSHEYISVPPPLGTDPVHYRFVDQHVSSNAPLERLVSEWPRYVDFLRPAAVTHFIAVTDDESDMSALEFDVLMRGLLGHEYTLHAIASEDVGGGHECSGAADVGERYYRLAAMTGGLQLSICTSDWTGVFDRLREHIFEAAPLPCTFAVPEAPADMTLDYMRVNVAYTPGSGGGGSILPFVGGEGGCAGSGWYYDDPAAPTEIVLCPASCAVVGADPSGRVDVTLGCETVLL